jgi:phosphoglycolate phosphatase-like HAD superfamily hydrolase
MHNLILFDLDGTLINLNADALDLDTLRSKVLEQISEVGVKPAHRSILHMYQQLIYECGFDHPVSIRTRRLLDTSEAQWARFKSTVLCDTQHIISLRQRQWALGIVTSNGQLCIQTLFEKKLQPKWFDIVVTRDVSPMLKPCPEPLRLAWELASSHYVSDQANIWYVGDSDSDFEACKSFNAWIGYERIRFVRVGNRLPVTSLSSSSASINCFLAARLNDDVA